jgi:hypothetical protein
VRTVFAILALLVGGLCLLGAYDHLKILFIPGVTNVSKSIWVAGGAFAGLGLFFVASGVYLGVADRK